MRSSTRTTRGILALVVAAGLAQPAKGLPVTTSGFDSVAEVLAAELAPRADVSGQGDWKIIACIGCMGVAVSNGLLIPLVPICAKLCRAWLNEL